MATPMQVSIDPATSTLQAGRALDYEKLKALGGRLTSLFTQYERDRRLAELRWAKNARQFLGVYDPEIEADIPKDRSKAYPKLTRVKCVSMLSRLMHLLFPTSEKNWSVTNTPVPNLSPEDLQLVLETLQLQDNPDQPLEDKMIEMAIVEFAKERSRNLEREIEDQLLEIGGSRQVDYVALCRKVLMSGIIYGMGVLKGPFVRLMQQRTWERDETGAIVARTYDVHRPQFDFVSLWDYYPDMSAKYLDQMDGQFQRIVMSRHQVRELADRPDFFSDIIKKYLRDSPKGNYRRRTYESEIKAMGAHLNVNDQDGRKYEILVWDGYISGRDLAAAGVDIPDDQLGDQIEAIVWILDGEVIKADMNPWVQLEVDQKVNTYHHFLFEEDESTITGNGLPNIMRDSQLAICATARMALDNASVVCGPNLEANLALLRQDQDLTSVHAYKVWYRDDDNPATAGQQAIRNVAIDSHVDDLMKLMSIFREFADTETFVNPATGGDMAKAPSEPFRTATGASLLKGDAALPFKDVVRNFDLFTQSVIASLVAFNMQFNPKRTIKGDHQVLARGTSSLMAKEVRGMVLDNLAQTLSTDDKRYLNGYELLKERLAARDVDVGGGIICSKDEANRRDQQAADAARQQQEQTDSLIRAEVRKILAEGVKNLTQADKNAAAADAQQAKTVMETLNASLGALEGAVDGQSDSGGAGNKEAAGGGLPAGAAHQSGRADRAGAAQAA